ncbi:hypothetical protein DFR70_105380 [Nocardia tenerifensis]|uniref:Uncharacterized protein n=1 Tax=Nocardia tenerifensis TaxID=228006 RepID=A0A318KPB7_9NOCA|nr:hypothetical protein [Nocardia tenerifensis]PXX64195.1 hypothetical protein DFR70_105380 [Nocardia tenerifensis]
MADLTVNDLPDADLTVLRRRARAAGLPLLGYLRAELIALARARCADDTIVEFLEAEGREFIPEIDAAAVALLDVYDLPADALAAFGRRAYATGQPLGDYVRRSLISSARRSTFDDAMLEFQEVQDRDPSLNLDVEAVAASVRYARGE